jgi:ferredoxin
VRLRQRIRDVVGWAIWPVAKPRNIHLLRFVPSLPRRRYAPPQWPTDPPVPPEGLRGTAGIQRIPELEDLAFGEQPVGNWGAIHAKGVDYLYRHGWEFMVPVAPRFQRAMHRARKTREVRPEPPAAQRSPQELAELIRAEGLRLGLSAVGFAPYDRRYTFAPAVGKHDEGTVIVCAVEQEWKPTQEAPALVAERAAFEAYTNLISRADKLARFVHGLGYRAFAQGQGGDVLIIHYGVEAGLGQLGLNGQLLTAQSGSRSRLSVITTNAEIARDHPVDLGIEKVCDECQACVRRCPVGAIRNKRTEHRGVVKAKIKMDRCFPTMVQSYGCAVCMKVCPVQRYGLPAVHEHYAKTGEILGKGTDELEGFSWPVDDQHYGPTEKPRLDSKTWLNPPGLIFDASHEAAPAVSAEQRAAQLNF